MNYKVDFGPVIAGFPALLAGCAGTLGLALAGMALAIVIGVGGVILRDSRHAYLRWIVIAFVELIRNTPFLVQLFMIFLGLPVLGVRLSPDTAAAVALTVNVGAYASEIIRAGIESVPRGQIEAGTALGLSRYLVFRHVVLKQALIAVYPALSSQFILLMLGTSVVSAIGAEELSATANSIQSRTFRAFEVYFVVTGIYLLLALFFRETFRFLYRRWTRQT